MSARKFKNIAQALRWALDRIAQSYRGDYYYEAEQILLAAVQEPVKKSVADGGPAFPCGLQSGHLQPMHEGLSLRDYFAAKALQGLLANPEWNLNHHSASQEAYGHADAMLKAREA